ALTGYLSEELETLDRIALVDEHDRGYVKQTLSELPDKQNDNQSRVIYRIVTKKGDIHWITNHISISDENYTDTMFGIMLNVTDIQMLNHQLKQRDRILTNSGRVAMIGGWEYDYKLDQVNFTDEIYDIYEVEKTDFDIRESVDYYYGKDAKI